MDNEAYVPEQNNLKNNNENNNNNNNNNNRRRLSFQVSFSLNPDPVALNKRRFSSVVTRKLSTTIGWKRSPEETVAVGRTLCILFVKNHLKQAKLFNKNLGLMSNRNALYAISESGRDIVRDIFPYLITTARELEILYPKLYCDILRQTDICFLTDTERLLLAIGHHLFKTKITWGKIVAIFCICGGLAVECVRRGHAEQIRNILEGMTEVLENRIVFWIISNGGWTALSTYCYSKDDKVYYVEHLGIFTLVLLIFVTVFVAIKFFQKVSMPF